jgi:hypothetical protein
MVTLLSRDFAMDIVILMEGFEETFSIWFSDLLCNAVYKVQNNELCQ